MEWVESLEENEKRVQRAGKQAWGERRRVLSRVNSGKEKPGREALQGAFYYTSYMVRSSLQGRYLCV